MKDLDKIIPIPEQINIVNQRQIDYEKKFLGTTVKHKGHTFFEINCTTGEIKEAEYKKEQIVLVEEKCLLTNVITGTASRIVKDVDCKENCLYIGALNLKSAKKKYLSWLIQSKLNKEEI